MKPATTLIPMTMMTIVTGAGMMTMTFFLPGLPIIPLRTHGHQVRKAQTPAGTTRQACPPKNRGTLNRATGSTRALSATNRNPLPPAPPPKPFRSLGGQRAPARPQEEAARPQPSQPPPQRRHLQVVVVCLLLLLLLLFLLREQGCQVQR